MKIHYTKMGAAESVNRSQRQRSHAGSKEKFAACFEVRQTRNHGYSHIIYVVSRSQTLTHEKSAPSLPPPSEIGL